MLEILRSRQIQRDKPRTIGDITRVLCIPNLLNSLFFGRHQGPSKKRSQITLNVSPSNHMFYTKVFIHLNVIMVHAKYQEHHVLVKKVQLYGTNSDSFFRLFR